MFFFCYGGEVPEVFEYTEVKHEQLAIITYLLS